MTNTELCIRLIGIQRDRDLLSRLIVSVWKDRDYLSFRELSDVLGVSESRIIRAMKDVETGGKTDYGGYLALKKFVKVNAGQICESNGGLMRDYQGPTVNWNEAMREGRTGYLDQVLDRMTIVFNGY